MHEKIRNNINEISLCIVMNNGELIEKNAQQELLDMNNRIIE